MTWEVLCKCSGKYIDIYFNLEMTYIYRTYIYIYFFFYYMFFFQAKQI